MSKQSSNLLTADGTLLYVFQELESVVDFPLASEFLSNLKSRIEQRRNKDLISLLYFLHHGVYPQSNEYFGYASKHKVKTLATAIMDRLFPKTSPEPDVESAIDDDAVEHVPDSESLNQSYNKLQMCISSFTTPKSQNMGNLNMEREFKLFEVNKGKRSERLQKLYNALLTVKPTSTSSERVFSVAGTIKTKLRNQMSSDTLNALIFLKFYFLTK